MLSFELLVKAMAQSKGKILNSVSIGEAACRLRTRRNDQASATLTEIEVWYQISVCCATLYHANTWFVWLLHILEAQTGLQSQLFCFNCLSETAALRLHSCGFGRGGGEDLILTSGTKSREVKYLLCTRSRSYTGFPLLQLCEGIHLIPVSRDNREH